MPSTYAHYRMGCRALEHLAPDVASCIRRHRHLYDLGVHGPDFLFFHDPLRKDSLYQLASQIHSAPGRDFFAPAVRQLRLSPDEGALAYLYGVLAHFALDSVCHPFINAKAAEGKVGHMEMETEFDRFLLELDGIPKPYAHPLTGHISIKNHADADRIARFYPHLDGKTVESCIRNYHFLMDFCTARRGLRRSLIGSGVFSGMANEMMMTPTANLRCEELTPEIYARYQKAEELYPRLMDQLQADLALGVPLGEAFDRSFG